MGRILFKQPLLQFAHVDFSNQQAHQYKEVEKSKGHKPSNVNRKQEIR